MYIKNGKQELFEIADELASRLSEEQLRSRDILGEMESRLRLHADLDTLSDRDIRDVAAKAIRRGRGHLKRN